MFHLWFGLRKPFRRRTPKEKTHEGTHVKKVIGIVSGKGGVGKSLVTSMMALPQNAADTVLQLWTQILQARPSAEFLALNSRLWLQNRAVLSLL